jgi:hypothetical protein
VVVVTLVFLGIGLTDELNQPRPHPPAVKKQDGLRPDPSTALDLKAAIEGLAR